jgi:rhodanese-related sulfurtransferase
MVGGARLMSTHRALAIAAIVLGALAPFAGSPYRATTSSSAIDVQKLAKEVAAEEDHVTALELAAWIKDRKPGLRVLDLRSEAEFDEYHLPRSESIAFDALVSSPKFAKDETLVLISDGGAHAAQAWVFLRALGYQHVYFLRGGVGEWLDEVMNPTKTTELTRYFGATPRKDSTTDSVTKMKRRGC